MGLSLIPPELTLDCSISSNTLWVPKTTVDFLAEVSKIQNASEKILKLDDYVNGMQDEMKKIDAFKRELPLCMLLLNDAATPKQIRELMQVDGLTNDEVKSHLQKYRLHTRKVPPTTNTSTIQPVMLGGLWMSQEHCGESLKLSSNSQSGSPQGPINLTGSSRVTSMSGDYSAEEEDDEKSESHSWKSQNHLTVRV